MDAQTVGDSVIEVGRAELMLDGGQTVAVKYVVHWKQEDGTWKWHTNNLEFESMTLSLDK